MQTEATSVRLPEGVHAVRHAAQLPRDGWDALAGPYDIYLTCRWLDVVEATAGVPMTYLWIERDGKPVAGLATALADASVPWALGRPDFVLRNSVKAGHPGAAEFLADLDGDPTALLMPALVAGGRHTGSTRVLRGPQTSREDIEALVAAAEALARQAGMATVCLLYLDEQDHQIRQVLDNRGYRHYEVGRYSTLPVPPAGYDAYLASLPKKRRYSIAADRRRIQQAEIEVTLDPLTSLTEAELARLADLESELLAKYDIDIRPDYLLPLLRQIRDCFGDDAYASVARAQGEIHGFAVILRHNDNWYTRQTGYDYEYQRRTGAPLYFEVLYYRLVEEAAAAGIRTIHYGLGSEDTKRSRGCSATVQRCHLLVL